MLRASLRHAGPRLSRRRHRARRGDHAAAFEHINAIAKAIEAPSTRAEVARNLTNDHPRFAPAHHSREGNSQQDIALSVYGFAIGYQAMAKGLDSPSAARAVFERAMELILAEHDRRSAREAAGVPRRRRTDRSAMA